MSTLADTKLEEQLLAAILLIPDRLPQVLADGLRAEHLTTGNGAAAFDAMVRITDRGAHLDPASLAAELERDERVSDPVAFASHLAEGSVYGLDLDSHPVSFAAQLRSLHRRRQIKHASDLLAQAADHDDLELQQQAERLLTSPVEAEQSSRSGKERAERYFDRMDAPAETRWSYGFPKLDLWTGRGLRRGQHVLIGGFTGAGKSVLYDQILEHLASQGLRVHSYINEMSDDERIERTMARLSGVPYHRIAADRISPEQRASILTALSGVHVGTTECHGWSAEEIARHIRWNRWDVAGVDLIHEIAHKDERDLAEIAQTLRQAAKSVGCALIACVHLNDNRVTSPQPPVPVLRDVRGTGMLVRGADVVLMVHRDHDSDGIPQPDGLLLAPKIRGGRPDLMAVAFDADRMRFLPSSSGLASMHDAPAPAREIAGKPF